MGFHPERNAGKPGTSLRQAAKELGLQSILAGDNFLVTKLRIW